MEMVSFRIDGDLKKLLKDVAMTNKRTITDEIVYRIEKTLREEKLLKPSEAELRINNLRQA